MQLGKKEIRKFQEEILDWYTKNKRDLPWRRPSLKLRNGKTRDPYAILVSEIMLQQTQVGRVIPKFEAWMKAFPSVQKLAKASTRDVLLYWSGLGYNRRALYLKKCAETLITQSANILQTAAVDRSQKAESIIWPQTEEELRKFPGIGEYTARALLCFAFDKQIAVVDTNIKKVILTFLKRKALSVKRKEEIQEIADQLLPKGKAYEWNQALMDYSSAMLKDKKIPIPKQSKFEGSNRYYRGQVVRLLLKQKETIDSLFKKVGTNRISKERFKAIIFQMKKEGILVMDGNKLNLP